MQESGPTTRSKTFQHKPIGTIVCWKFDGFIYHEGEVTQYDPINLFYTIKYQDGDSEEYNHSEIRLYKKKYRHKHFGYMLISKTDNNLFFIPTKALPNPVKLDYKLRNATSLLKQKLTAL